MITKAPNSVSSCINLKATLHFRRLVECSIKPLSTSLDKLKTDEIKHSIVGLIVITCVTAIP